MKLAIKIFLKKEILDLEGRAIQDVLKKKYKHLKNCSVGKYIVLESDQKDKTLFLKEAQKIASEVLADKLTEDFEIEILN